MMVKGVIVEEGGMTEIAGIMVVAVTEGGIVNEGMTTGVTSGETKRINGVVVRKLAQILTIQ
jgi:hypothetical protein